MKVVNIMAIKFILSVLVLVAVRGNERIKDSIYRDFTQFRACFKRLNGTMEVGCTSELGGNVGVLQYIDSTDISVVENADFAPYIVIISPQVFSSDLLERLKSTGNLQGVILPGIKEGKWKGKMPAAISEDSPCPNSGSSLYSDRDEQCGSSDKPWNKAGESILWQNWDFPIFLINDAATTQSLFDCYNDHNSGTDPDWPLCAVELTSAMYAAKDSETCWRRSTMVNSLTPQRFCDPLSDNNIFYFLSPRNSTTADDKDFKESANSVIVVLARMDALNIFEKEEVGFDSPSTGIVTLLAAVKALKLALGESWQYKSGVENVMFLLVHGESFDYIGSNRAVFDMMSETFPFDVEKHVKDGVSNKSSQPSLNLQNIRLIIELGQLSNKESAEMFLHTANANQEVNDVIDSLKSFAPGLFRGSTRNILPPASAQSFLKERSDIPVLMLTNFDQQYTNNFFHSIYDNSIVNNYNYSAGDNQQIVQHLAKLGGGMATALTKLATGRSTSANKAELEDVRLVNELLHCYTETANCSMFRTASSPSGYPWEIQPRSEVPFPQYISVGSTYHTNFTAQILMVLAGDNEDGNKDIPSADVRDALQLACWAQNHGQDVFNYIFLVGEGCFNDTGVVCGGCYKTTVGLSMARSPAFDEDIVKDYDWSSGVYPTWTESIWVSMSGRMFLKPSPASQHTALAIGVLVCLISIPLTYWIEKKSSVLFNASAAPLAAAYTNPVSL